MRRRNLVALGAAVVMTATAGAVAVRPSADRGVVAGDDAGRRAGLETDHGDGLALFGIDLDRLAERPATGPVPGADGTGHDASGLFGELPGAARPHSPGAAASAADASVAAGSSLYGATVVGPLAPGIGVRGVDGPFVPAARTVPTGAAIAATGTTVAFGATGVQQWHDAGYLGDGTTVAVIDTGFAGWSQAQAAGRVPAPRPGDDIDRCDAGFEGRAHGTATGEVVAAVAPHARQVRVCIDDATDLADAVTALIARGDIDVVNMSLGFYNSGPGDGTGVAGSPDDSARRAIAAGLAWVNAAGNEAQLHHGAPFGDADGDGLHEFAAGEERGSFTVPAGAEVEVFLRWDQWDAAPPPDGFRLCFAADPADPLNCLDAVQPDRDTPTTGVALTNRRDTPVTFEVAVRRVRGAGSPAIDLFFSDAEGWTFPVPASSVVDPATVQGVVAVGSACVDSGAVQAVSSRGPLADGRPGVSLVAPGALDSDVFRRVADCPGGFGGSSASAPFAAGALALLGQADPTATGAELAEELLRRTATAAGGTLPVRDPVAGAGLLSVGTPPPFRPAGNSALTFAVATRSDRSDAVPLGRQVLSGLPFIHLTPLFPSPAPVRVEFYIDDTLVNVEITPTLDVGGGLPQQAFPVDTTRLTDGRHRLTAVVSWSDGRREWVVAPLVVDNRGVPAPSLPGVVVGPDGAPLDRTVVRPDAVLSLRPVAFPAAEIDHVWFWIDARFAGRVYNAPYRTDLATFAGLGPGQHMIRAAVVTRSGALWAVDANFVVRAG